MLGFSLGIAGSFSLGSLVANEIDPVAITAARFLGTIPIMGFIAVIGQSRMKWKNAQAPWRYAICGALMAAYFVLMFEGLKTAPAISTSAVFTLTPIMSGLFGWILLGQLLVFRTALALMVGAIGALWVIFRADLNALLAFQVGKGEAIFFIGCIAHAFYTPLVRRLNRGESPAVLVFGMSLTGTLLLFAYGWREIIETDWLSLPLIVWITLGYLTIIATAMTILAVSYAAMRLPAAKVMAYTFLTPTWVIVWEVLLGQDFPSTSILLGIVATIIALILLLREDKI